MPKYQKGSKTVTVDESRANKRKKKKAKKKQKSKEKKYLDMSDLGKKRAKDNTKRHTKKMFEGLIS